MFVLKNLYLKLTLHKIFKFNFLKSNYKNFCNFKFKILFFTFNIFILIHFKMIKKISLNFIFILKSYFKISILFNSL